MKAKIKFLKEILKYSANKHRNDKKVNLPYCWYKENFSGLDRKSNQTQHSLKPKPGPEQGSAAAAAKSIQSYPTLCDPMDGTPPGSPVPGILQARTLEWGAISFSNALKWKVKVKSLSRVRLLATPWTAALQASLSMGFSRQEYWSGVPLPSLSCAISSY